MNDCIFCRIAEGVAPTSMVYSDENTVAFLDTQPINPGHILVIPKAHAARLSDLDAETGAQLFGAVLKVADALARSEIKPEGVNLYLADGKAAGQEVLHVHLHVIPRFRDDRFRIQCGPSYGSKPSRTKLEAIASKIRKAMRQGIQNFCGSFSEAFSAGSLAMAFLAIS